MADLSDPVTALKYSFAVLIDPATGIPYAATGVAGGPAVTIANGADATLGAIANAAVVDPTASATVISLLKGILTQLLAANVLLETIADNTTPA